MFTHIAFREIKFDALVQRLGDDVRWIATGSSVSCSSGTCSLNTLQATTPACDGTPPLALRDSIVATTDIRIKVTFSQRYRSTNYAKYVSHVLQTLNADLAQFMFPIGNLDKSDVRQLARQYNLPTAAREDSVGICFVGQKRRFERFICKLTAPHSPGAVCANHDSF